MHVSIQKLPSEEGKKIPPLQAGDRLTRPEFERRFDATPNLKRAELLEGVVYMPPPVSYMGHGGPHFNVIAWLGAYAAATSGVLGGDNSSLRLDLDNEPQPDAFLLVDPKSRGQARVDEEGYVEGAPELIVEVAASSVSYDLHVKLNVYRRHGVREYVVWRTLDEAIDWFVLREGEYLPLEAVLGVFRSEVMPGLWLDAEALLRGDLGGVERVLREGLATQDHARFVKQLAEPRQ